MKVKLAEEVKERKFATATLENAEKQAKSQQLLLRSTEEQLATSKEQIATLKKKLEEVEQAKALAKKSKDAAEKAKDEAEQHKYEVGVAETEDALRAEVPSVCRIYCALTWDEALNQARVEASSVLRKAESVYYPLPYTFEVLQTPTVCSQNFYRGGKVVRGCYRGKRC